MYQHLTKDQLRTALTQNQSNANAGKIDAQEALGVARTINAEIRRRIAELTRNFAHEFPH